MIKVSIELIESMDGRQMFVTVAEMVLSELACFVANCFENHGQGWIPLIKPDGRPCQSNRRHASTNR